MIPPDVLVALAVSGSSLGAMLTAAAAEASGGGGDLAPWVGGGAGGVAVAALAYVVRAVITGRLVVREVSDREVELGAAIRDQAKVISEQAMQVRRYEELVTEQMAQGVRDARLFDDLHRALGENAAEMRWWREQRERLTGASS